MTEDPSTTESLSEKDSCESRASNPHAEMIEVNQQLPQRNGSLKKSVKILERAMGIEPPTSSLGSTTNESYFMPALSKSFPSRELTNPRINEIVPI